MDIDEQQLYSLEQVELVVDQKNLSKGKLLLTSLRISWTGSNDETHDWAWRSIVMHAVSKDPTLSPNGSIYCQVAKARSEMTEEEREAEEDGEDLEPFGEVRFIPSDGSTVEALFEAFSKGAEMNPDPLEEGDDEEGEFFFGDDNMDGEQQEPTFEITTAEGFEEMMNNTNNGAEESFEDAKGDGH